MMTAYAETVRRTVLDPARCARRSAILVLSILLARAFVHAEQEGVLRADPQPGQSGPRLTVAAIPGRGEHRPSDEVLGLFEARILGALDVDLVERGQIARILDEFALDVATLTDPSARLRLGNLVPADAMIFIDGISGAAADGTYVQVTDAKTGVNWGSWIWANSDFADREDAVVRALRAALSKGGVPAEQRHFIGLLDFRGEESGTSLDATAAALGELVLADLGALPDVVVLDRDHLNHLRTEAGLTPIDQRLRASTFLLEAGFRPGAGAGEVDVTVALRPLAGGNARETRLTVRRDDLLSAKADILKTLAISLQTESPANVQASAPVESEAFARQVNLWRKWGDKGRAVRAAVTAFALDPSQTNRLILASTIASEGATLEERVRADRMLLDYYDVHIAALQAGSVTNLMLPFLGYHSALGSTDDDEATRRLRRELLDLEEQVFRKQLDHYRQHYADVGAEYWNTWMYRLGALKKVAPCNYQAQGRLIREAVDAFASPPSRPEWAPRIRLQSLTVLANGQIQPPATWSTPCDWLCHDGESTAFFLNLFRDLKGHADPLVRFVANLCISQILCARVSTPEQQREEVASRLEMLRIVIEDLTPEHPYRAVATASDWRSCENDVELFSWCGCAFSVPKWAVEQKLALYAEIMKTLVQTDDPLRISALDQACRSAMEWPKQMIDHGKTAEAAALVQGMLDVMKRHDEEGPTSEALAKLYEQCQRLTNGPRAPEPPPPSRNDPAWDDYEIRRVNLGFRLRPSGWYPRAGLLMMAEGDRLTCVTPTLRGHQPIWSVGLGMAVYRVPACQREQELYVPLRLSLEGGDSSGIWKRFLLCAAEDAGTVYVGTTMGLLIASLNEGRYEWFAKEQGLPGTTVRALGWLDGSLYLGIGCHPTDGEGPDASVFASLDTTTRRFRVIASEKGVGRSTPWDGVRFHMDDILPDRARGVLWLKERLTGIWKYTPSTDVLERMPDSVTGSWPMMVTSRHPARQLVPQGSMTPTNARQGRIVSLFCPEDLWRMDLPWEVNGDLLVIESMAAARYGEQVILTVRHQPRHEGILLLVDRAMPKAAVLRQWHDGKPMPATPYLQGTSAGVMAVTAEGDAFFLRRMTEEARLNKKGLQERPASGEQEVVQPALHDAHVRTMLEARDSWRQEEGILSTTKRDAVTKPMTLWRPSPLISF